MSEEQVAELDAKYVAFPPFSEWEAREIPAQWATSRDQLEAVRMNSAPQALSDAIQLVMRAAAIDTGAIEGLYDVDRGFTLTVATQATAWEEVVRDRGQNVRALFEAQLAAYDLVLDAATRATPVPEAWIRRLHEEVCAPQDTSRVLTAVGWQDHPLPKGEYKRHPTHVQRQGGAVHSYAPVVGVPAEMARLVRELGSPAFEDAHPVDQAAYAHYAFVVIHPFADGNGRVARALASTYLYRAARIPLLIFADRRNDYFSALQAADRGDSSVFTHFVLDAALSALSLTAETMATAQAPNPEHELEAIHQLLTTQEG
jgi:Fic family protein